MNGAYISCYNWGAPLCEDTPTNVSGSGKSDWTNISWPMRITCQNYQKKHWSNNKAFPTKQSDQFNQIYIYIDFYEYLWIVDFLSFWKNPSTSMWMICPHRITTVSASFGCFEPAVRSISPKVSLGTGGTGGPEGSRLKIRVVLADPCGMPSNASWKILWFQRRLSQESGDVSTFLCCFVLLEPGFSNKNSNL